MSKNEAFLRGLYEHLLRREPGGAEMKHWTDLLDGGMPATEVFEKFVGSPEYKTKLTVRTGHPPGHFYSPIVDPEALGDYWRTTSSATLADLDGVAIDTDAMLGFWRDSAAMIREAPFTFASGGATRYFFDGGHYPNVDAMVLMSMMRASRPKRIIEIGSGFSSAVMLDTADALGLAPFELLCIDPYADRLRSLLRTEDAERVTIREEMVQQVPVGVFAALEAGDILFIDSSHVLKTGSDVHFELFSVLPVLKPGVLVHFHDIHFPFEYPKPWVFEKRWAWNEIYAVRAFLMYNERFRVRFWTDYFIGTFGSVVREAMPDHNFQVGGSLWLEVT